MPREGDDISASDGRIDPGRASADTVEDQTAALVRALLDASQQLDGVGVTQVLTDAAAIIGLGPALDDVVLPAMRQIGSWWAAGDYTIPQEQLTTEAVRSWLDRLSTSAGPPHHLPPILLACGPRDRHTIGAEALALLLRMQSRHCRVLGSRISADNLMFAAMASAPAAVVIVSHLVANRRYALEAAAKIHESGIPVFYAGNAFADEDSRAGIPGAYLGTNLQAACSQICGVLEEQ